MIEFLFVNLCVNKNTHAFGARTIVGRVLAMHTVDLEFNSQCSVQPPRFNKNDIKAQS